MKTAFVFPGQASQYPGMGKELYENHEVARAIFNAADEALGFSISQLCFEGTESDLQLTANTQPAILTVSIAAFEVLRGMGVTPDYVAGHSLGEYSALVAAGALDFRDAVVLVRKRGTYMQEAVPVGQGAMAAIIGGDYDKVAAICSEVSEDGVCVPANLNSPSQLVIAGHRAAVERALSLIKERKVGRGRMLPVSAPFHSPLMKPAEEALKVDLEATTFHNLRYPMVNNVDAAIVTTGEAARDGLIRQVCSAVRWSESVKMMCSSGVTRFVEVGPKNVLAGLIKQIAEGAEILNVEDTPSAKRVAAVE